MYYEGVNPAEGRRTKEKGWKKDGDLICGEVLYYNRVCVITRGWGTKEKGGKRTVVLSVVRSVITVNVIARGTPRGNKGVPCLGVQLQPY